MVSLGPYSKSRDYSYMYDLYDIKSSEIKPNENTILDLISSNDQFGKFLELVKIAQMENIFNNLFLHKTIFIPLDKYIPDLDVSQFDKNTAMQIIKYSMLNNIIDSSLLGENSVSCLINNSNNDKRLYFSIKNNDIYINENTKIVGYDILCANGMIHTTDNLLIPIIL
jgi:uncharacterized surface protein with fasciclin (FAS1) repeats